MIDKVKCAQEFLRSLEQHNVTTNMMAERMDVQILHVMKNYSGLIAKIKDKINMEDKEILTCSMIMGYLLKGHLDRLELEERMNG